MGCSAFGMEDCVAIYGSNCAKQDFCLADVLLPTHVFGTMRTGSQAKGDRTHTGLHWPLEARVEERGYLRRVPVSYAWRLLVEAGDSLRRWSIQNGVSFPVERIVAAHVKYLFKDNGFQKGEDHAIVAIPNSLDEFAQENLLRELKEDLTDRNKDNLLLVWRPITAALSWLDRVQDTLPLPRDDGTLLVVYLGPDGLEFVPLRLRIRNYEGRRYIIPLRDRPGPSLALTGFDWASRVIQECWPNLPAGAFWQAFTGFPEVWKALAQRSWIGLMRPWSLENEWTYWHPESDLRGKVWKALPETSVTLSKLTETSCPRLGTDFIPIFQTWEEMLQEEMRRALDAIPQGHLWGMIIYGALAPVELPRWLTDISFILTDKGLQLNGSLSEPRLRGLWLPTQKGDPMAEGAAIYGQRTLAGTPTYLDTLPLLATYAMKKCQYEWIPLVDVIECEGGKEYYKEINGSFKLREGDASLDFYLKKQEQVASAYAAMVPTRGLKKEFVEAAQKKVKELGSLQAVLSYPKLKGNSDYESYAKAYAQVFYSEAKEGKERIKPYRQTKFTFPLAPAKDIILDLEVRMRPASGMAKVEIKPREVSFLKGRTVFLDYSNMVPIGELPDLEKGAPDITKFEVEPGDNVLLSNEELFVRFQNISPPSPEYFNSLKSIKNILSKTAREFHYNRYISFKIIDHDGRTDTAQGQKLIDRLAQKISFDFSGIGPGSPHELKFFTNATWLFLTTPPNVINRLIEVLGQAYDTMPLNHWNWSIEAGSRSFNTVEAFVTLFTTICERINRPPIMAQAFPIQSDRAVWRVLAFREKGFEGLERHQAKLLTGESVKIMEEQAAKQNFKRRYFQAAQLFFFLLRFRCKDSSFLNPDNPDDKYMFDRAISCLKRAETYFRGRMGGQRARKIITGIEEYMYFRGKGIVVFDEFTEDGGGGTADD